MAAKKKSRLKKFKPKSNHDGPRDNSGAIFDASSRAKHDRSPDYTGSAMVDGKEYWISAWVKPPSGRATEDWLSLAFTPKEDQVSQNEDFDDDIPF